MFISLSSALRSSLPAAAGQPNFWASLAAGDSQPKSYKNLEIPVFIIVLQEKLTGRYFDKCWVLITTHQHQAKSCLQEGKDEITPWS